jgi:beta-mannanase
MIEFGPEVNGYWFPWNGKWHGGGVRNRYGDPSIPDGPEKFRDAYKRLIDIFRAVGAMNITWVLHVDAAGSPHEEWNKVKYYYPGDDYIDWIGISVFGRQLPQNNWIFFPIVLKRFMAQLEETTKTKPFMISEYGVIEDDGDPTRKAKWIRQAFQSISRGLFPQVKGMTYWNSPGWLPRGRASFKIDTSPEALEAYRTEISQAFWIDRPVLTSEM